MPEPGQHPQVHLADVSEIRRHVVLRALIDEMLDRVRELRRELRTMGPRQRADAEADLDALMARIRYEALRMDVD